MFYNFIISIIGFVFSTVLFAHSSITAKDTLDQYAGRSYKEGTSAFFSVSMPHGCADANHGAAKATTDVALVFPNSNDLQGSAYTKDSSGNKVAGNALMSIKPQLNANWKVIERIRGNVPAYFNHGLVTTDVRGIQYRSGYLPDDMIEQLTFNASLPILDGCVETLKVYIGIAQYCEHGGKQIWIKAATAALPSAVCAYEFQIYGMRISNASVHSVYYVSA